MKKKTDFLKMNMQSQAKVFNEMAENVQKKFPNDIKAQANSLGKAFDKVIGKRVRK